MRMRVLEIQCPSYYPTLRCIMSKERTVLAIFDSRRRPITFASGETPKEEYRNLLEAVVRDFHDVLGSNEGPSSMDNYFL